VGWKSVIMMAWFRLIHYALATPPAAKSALVNNILTSILHCIACGASRQWYRGADL